MQIKKILDLENDGLNMAADEAFLYIRRKREMHKYGLADMKLIARNVIFKKDGRARGFKIYRDRIFLTDFCDLYILNKDDLQIRDIVRIGGDLSSDIWGGGFRGEKTYIAVRNGKMAVVEIDMKSFVIHEICDSSFWDYSVAGNRIFAGTVKGELIEINADNMQIIKKIALCKKNIYGVKLSGNHIYTVSQDTTIKIIDTASFEIVCEVKKAVRGMAKIIGFHGDNLFIADSGQAAFWDKESLTPRERFSFPVNGAVLAGDNLFGSDNQGVYRGHLLPG